MKKTDKERAIGKKEGTGWHDKNEKQSTTDSQQLATQQMTPSNQHRRQQPCWASNYPTVEVGAFPHGVSWCIMVYYGVPWCIMVYQLRPVSDDSGANTVMVAPVTNTKTNPTI